MLRRLVVLMIVLAAALCATTVDAEPAAAHTCSGSGEVTMDPTPDDQDDDCVTDSQDNCPGVPNADQIDSDNDTRGDRCDEDDDNDGLIDPDDNCRTVPNVDQTRTQHPVYGDACLFDRDADGTIDAEDNCRSRANADQADNERDGAGNVCDADDDNDALLDERDNCPLNSNKDQADTDGDRIGDACDPDTYTGPAFVAPPGVAQPKAADRTKASVSLKLPRTQRGKDARGGMPASVRCSEACSISGELTLSRAVAKRLKVKALVARGEAALDGPGTTYLFLDFTRKAMKRLFRGPAVKATLALEVVDAAGNATSARRTVRLAK
jgi:hypothetical protein